MASSPRPRRTRVAALLVAVGVLASGAACAASTSGATAANGQLVWGKPTDATVLDPALAGDAADWEVLNLVYDRLVNLGANMSIVPELASSWARTSPTTYVFDLRSGVKFSNGREMTADDVVGSLQRLVDPKLGSFWAGDLGIAGVSAVGAHQVKVTLAAPRASFVAALAASPAAILPIKELKAGTFNPAKQLLGTGPFEPGARTPGQSWTFERNPYYWRPGLPKVDKLSIRVIPDDTARTAALQDGTIDVTTYENPDSIRLLKGRPNIKAVTQSTGDYYVVDVNASSSSVFADDRLRQALALSLDRRGIRDVALAGVGRPTASVPPTFPGICDPATVPLGTPDLARARQLVAAAGASGKTVNILTFPAVAMSSPIAQMIQQEVAQTGLGVRIVPLDTGEVIKRALDGQHADFDLIVSWWASYADPAMAVTWYNPNLALWNKPWMKPDPQLDGLVNQGLATPGGAARTQTLKQACDRIASDANIIPLVTKDAIIAYRSDKITPAIPAVEGYAVPLRQLAEFGLK